MNIRLLMRVCRDRTANASPQLLKRRATRSDIIRDRLMSWWGKFEGTRQANNKELETFRLPTFRLSTFNLRTFQFPTGQFWKKAQQASHFRFPTSHFRLRTSHFRLLTIALAIASLSSCVSYPELVNFNADNFPQSQTEKILNTMELKIQPEDLLRITVHSNNPAAAQPYNLENVMQGNQQPGFQQQGQGNQMELFMGYFVDQQGFIDFPGLGRIEVGGLTLDRAKFKIYEGLRPFLTDAVINIRFLNFKVTVSGEVSAPGIIRLTNKRVTLLEAIGQAGDLTQYANRKNILMIREKDGQREYARINLQSPDIFSSPYFYLQQNDFIYIEPLRVRTATVADPAQRIISYSTAALSLVSIIIALTR